MSDRLEELLLDALIALDIVRGEDVPVALVAEHIEKDRKVGLKAQAMEYLASKRRMK